MLRILVKIRENLGTATYATAAFLFVLWLYHLYDGERIYYQVDAHPIKLDAAGVEACKGFDKDYYNIMVASALRSALWHRDRMISVKSNLQFVDDSASIGSISTMDGVVESLSDDSSIVEAIYRSGILSNEVRRIVVYFDLDTNCKIDKAQFLYNGAIFPIVLTDNIWDLGEYLLTTIDKQYSLQKEVSINPAHVRGLAFGHFAEEGPESPQYANLIGVSYLVEASKEGKRGSQRLLYHKALIWFNRAIRSERNFKAAIINREKTKLKLSDYRVGAYEASVDTLLGQFHRERLIGYHHISENGEYLEACTSILMDLINIRQRFPGLIYARDDIIRAEDILDLQIKTYGASETVLTRLKEVHMLLARLDSSPHEAELSEGYDAALAAFKREAGHPPDVPPQ